MGRAIQCHDVSLVTTKGVWVGLYNVMMYHWSLLRGYNITMQNPGMTGNDWK